MKKILMTFLMIIIAVTCFAQEKKDVVEKKWFSDNSTFIIICRGWPKESLSGDARLQSAKEAALMNAQFISRDLFDSTVDVVKNGTIEKYEIADDYVKIKYVIKYFGLRKFYKGPKL